jgi:DMSO/TMAO reductase YedYZ molybdopterin-dependent catalytic subunit
MIARCAGFVVALVMLAGAPALAAGVSIGGQVQHPSTLTAEDLQKLPATTVPTSFQTDKGVESASYTGALLWTVLAHASPIDAAGKNARLRHVFLVKGSDGYVISLSEGELDPMFENKSIILAYAKDGKPIDGIRLVVPGDKHGGRAVRDVVGIDVQ